MTAEDPSSKSMLEDEVAVRWSWLEDEPEACAVVSRRMELLYLNALGRQLVADDWFAKRCWEVFPTEDESCLWRCPAIQVVAKSGEITYHEETLALESGPLHLGVAVIPQPRGREDRAGALLLLRSKAGVEDESTFRATLLADAESLQGRVGDKPR